MNATNANARSFFSPLRVPSFFTLSCNPASLSLLVAWASLSFSPPLGHPPATANLIAIVAHHLVADCCAVPHITPWSPARPSPFAMPSPPAIAAPSTAAWWECPIPNTHQIRRTANAALEASTPSRRHRERGRGSGGRARSRSPPGLESSRKRCHSRSPKYEQGLPSEHREKRSHNGVQRPRRDRLEFFQSGAGPRGGACVVCLGCHEHTFLKCNGAKLWDGSAGSARKNEQGRLVAADGLPLCFDWQMPRGCVSTSHLDQHRCSGCGKANHGAQACP